MAAEEQVLLGDVQRGVLLTLAVSFIMTACAVGISQTAQVLDRRDLYVALSRMGLELRQLAAAFGEASGVICEGLRATLPPELTAPGSPQVLAISLMKLDGERLMAVLTDATLEVQREQETLLRRLRTPVAGEASTEIEIGARAACFVAFVSASCTMR